MERILLYFDALDDLYGMVGLLAERLRRFALSLICLLALTAIAVSGGWLALANPLIGLAVCYLLGVTLLYRLVTAPPLPQSA